MEHETDVVVVGGGVAGSATALGLVALGRSVTLVDRADFPREKACGEGLMPHGLAALDALGISVPGRPFGGITYSVGEVRAEGRFPEGLVGLGVRRRDLDAALGEACRARGVQVRTGCRARGLSGSPGAMRVQTDQGELGCRAVVGADGLHSPVRGWLGLSRPPTGRPRFGARQHFRLAPGVSEGDRVQVHVVPDRGIELYLTPTAPGELNVALLLEKREMAALRGDVAAGVLACVAACPAVSAILEGAEPISDALAVGPLRQEALRGVADGALLVGDAAGFLDAITGEGMSLTLIEAAIAAEVLDAGLACGQLGAEALAVYDLRRHARSRDLTRLTQVILWGIRHRMLARWVVRNLGRHPEVFDRVLEVNVDRAPLRSVGLGGLRRLVLGW